MINTQISSNNAAANLNKSDLGLQKGEEKPISAQSSSKEALSAALKKNLGITQNAPQSTVNNTSDNEALNLKLKSLINKVLNDLNTSSVKQTPMLKENATNLNFAPNFSNELKFLASELQKNDIFKEVLQKLESILKPASEAKTSNLSNLFKNSGVFLEAKLKDALNPQNLPQSFHSLVNAIKSLSSDKIANQIIELADKNLDPKTSLDALKQILNNSKAQNQQTLKNSAFKALLELGSKLENFEKYLSKNPNVAQNKITQIAKHFLQSLEKIEPKFKQELSRPQNLVLKDLNLKDLNNAFEKLKNDLKSLINGEKISTQNPQKPNSALNSNSPFALNSQNSGANKAQNAQNSTQNIQNSQTQQTTIPKNTPNQSPISQDKNAPLKQNSAPNTPLNANNTENLKAPNNAQSVTNSQSSAQVQNSGANENLQNSSNAQHTNSTTNQSTPENLNEPHTHTKNETNLKDNQANSNAQNNAKNTNQSAQTSQNPAQNTAQTQNSQPNLQNATNLNKTNATQTNAPQSQSAQNQNAAPELNNAQNNQNSANQSTQSSSQNLAQNSQNTQNVVKNLIFLDGQKNFSELEALSKDLNTLNTQLSRNLKELDANASAAKTNLADIKNIENKAATALKDIVQIANKSDEQISTSIKNDIKSTLLQTANLAKSIGDESTANMANRLLTQIELNQLVSLANDSFNTYVPYFWEDLQDSKLVFKRGKKDKFFAQIKLDFKTLGQLDVLIALNNEKYIDINIMAENKDFRKRIYENAHELKRAINKAGLLSSNFFVGDIIRSKFDDFNNVKGRDYEFEMGIDKQA